MNKFMGIACLSVAATLYGCKDKTHKEVLAIARDYTIPNELQTALKDVPVSEHTDTILYQGAIARIQSEFKSMNSLSVVTKVTIYKTEKDSVSVKGRLETSSADTIRGSILFWESSTGRSKLVSRPFEVADNGTIIKL